MTVDASKVVRTADRTKLIGVNVALYNKKEQLKDAHARKLIDDLAIGLMRAPGGSGADKYYWNGYGIFKDGKADQSKFKDGYWEVDYSGYAPGFVLNPKDWSKCYIQNGWDVKFLHEFVKKHKHAQNLVTINAGTGPAKLAAEWVRWANKKNDYNIKYWEIGNELIGSWEPGHFLPDGTELTASMYAQRFSEFAKAMKAVDPTIKVGGAACGSHHPDFTEAMLKDAGQHVDFITFHLYPTRNSLAEEDEFFAKIFSLKKIMKEYEELAKKYQPDRAAEIEIGITEWNSKLTSDRTSFDLANGLWFCMWVGEMMDAGVDFATLWDMFAANSKGGHGLLFKDGNYKPTSRYWAFWLWSHYMADDLVESSVSGAEQLYSTATKSDDFLYVMLVNRSREQEIDTIIDITGFAPAAKGQEITLSHREYFWNPYKGRADWNNGPKIEKCDMADKMLVAVPPFSVKVFKMHKKVLKKRSWRFWRRKPEIKILLPEQGVSDLPVEGWVRVCRKGSDDPYSEAPPSAGMTVQGPAEIDNDKVRISEGAGRFFLEPKGDGKVTVVAEADGLEASKQIVFNPVKYTPKIAWTFEDALQGKGYMSNYSMEFDNEWKGHNEVVKIRIPDVIPEPHKNYLLGIKNLPRAFPRERIGGVVFDLFVPEDLKCEDKNAQIIIVMESSKKFWMRIGDVKINENKGKWRTAKVIVPAKFLRVMDGTFGVKFMTAAKTPIDGSIYLDNIGFLLR
ncbi:glycoside hydrolase family 44 protein [Verrucomicrobiota bacterium]